MYLVFLEQTKLHWSISEWHHPKHICTDTQRWTDAAGAGCDVGQWPASWTGMQPLSQTTVRCRSACSSAIMAPVVSHWERQRRLSDTDELPHGWSEPWRRAEQQWFSVWTAAFNMFTLHLQVIICRHPADLMCRCTEFYLSISVCMRETVEKVYVNNGIRIFDHLHDKILDCLQTWVFLSSLCMNLVTLNCHMFKVRTLFEFKSIVC